MYAYVYNHNITLVRIYTLFSYFIIWFLIESLVEGNCSCIPV